MTLTLLFTMGVQFRCDFMERCMKLVSIADDTFFVPLKKQFGTDSPDWNRILYPHFIQVIKYILLI